MDINTIQYKDVIPNTHFFVYKNKKYPFKFDYFKYGSKYFSANQKELEEMKTIQILDDHENDTSITEDVINKFIKFIQSEKIQLDNENVIGLNYLSQKYEVKILEEKTSEYIGNHQEELVIQNLIDKQNQQNFDTKIYENIISNNIIKYIDDPRLLSVKIPVLYRIIQKTNLNEKYIEKLIEFLIKCLDKYGKNASVLFDNISFGKLSRQYVNLLINEYSTKINFEYIASNLIVEIKEYENELQSNSKKFSNTISNKEKEIGELKQQISNIEEQNNALNKKIELNQQQYLKNIESQKQNEAKMNEKYEKLISIKESEIVKIKEQNVNLSNQNKNLLNDIKQNQQKFLKELDNKNQIIIKKDTEITIIKQKNSSLIEKSSQLEKEKQDLQIKIKSQQDQHLNENNEMTNKLKKRINEQDQYKIISLPHDKGDFNGIFKYLNEQAEGNIRANKIIEISTNSILKSSFNPYNLIDFKSANDYAAKQGDFYPWVCFDFKEMKAKIISYTIKSSHCSIGHLKNWIIEVSNDNNKWITIDEHRNDSSLKGENISMTFSTQPNDFYRFCRIRHNGEYWGYEPRFTSVEFNSIELYGNLKVPK